MNRVDPGIIAILERTRTSGGGEEPTDLKVKVTPGIILAGIVTGATMALGSGLINRFVWKK